MNTVAILINFTSNDLALLENTLVDDTYNNIIENFSKNLSLLSENIFISPQDQDQFNQSKVCQALSCGYKIIESNHEIKTLKTLFEKNKTIIYFSNIFLLFNLEISQKLLSIHKQFLADYSFGENIPAGLCPVIFQSSIFDTALQSNEEIPDELPMALSSYIEKNINKFHVEIHYEEPDLRMLRLDFSAKNLRSLSLIDKVVKESANSSLSNLSKLFKEKPQTLYHFPSYIEVELISECDLNCTFCPRQYIENQNNQLNEKEIEKIITFCDQGLGDTHIALGGMGEPLQHPHFEELAKKLINSNSTKSLIVETNGINLDKIIKLLEAIEQDEKEKLKIILNLNSLKNYTTIHGQDKLTLILECINKLVKFLDNNNLSHLKKSVYLQMLKIEENEDETDNLFALSDELGIGFILQKYNTYNIMPQKRVSDMTPLERSSCWHLRRDMTIKANGDVSYCKQDVSNKNIRGNIKTKNLNKIWSQQQSSWVKNYQQKLETNPNCQSCDEYFTFNL